MRRCVMAYEWLLSYTFVYVRAYKQTHTNILTYMYMYNEINHKVTKLLLFSLLLLLLRPYTTRSV